MNKEGNDIRIMGKILQEDKQSLMSMHLIKEYQNTGGENWWTESRNRQIHCYG